MGMKLFFICPKCSINLRTPKALAAHMAHHSQPKPVVPKEKPQCTTPNLQDLSLEELKEIAKTKGIFTGNKKAKTLIKDIQACTNLPE